VNYEQELNPQQLAVVMAGQGPMLVIAGPGSGKTRTVTYRVARLVETGTNPDSILLLTFTNKAARTMLDRVANLLPVRTLHFWGGTFHHIGNVILRKHAKLIGYQNNYTILDREDSKDLINDILKTIKLDTPPKNFPKSNILAGIFGYAANTGREIKETIGKDTPQLMKFSADIIRIFDIYTAKKLKQNLMDFDDLLLNWKKLFEEHQTVRDFYARKFIYTLVDEYQDTNHLQGEIIERLAGVHRNLTVVGDDAQSIYSFRGADFTNIMEFPNRYPEAKIYKLEANYRSTPEILRLANCCIKHNTKQFPKNLQALCPEGEYPKLVILDNNFAQAKFVTKEILELHRREKIPLNQMAVLYRAHYQSMELQMELANLKLPFEIRSGLRFFEQAHLKDVLSYLKIISNFNHELAWQRALKLYPGIGPASAEHLWKTIKELKNLSALPACPDGPPEADRDANRHLSAAPASLPPERVASGKPRPSGRDGRASGPRRFSGAAMKSWQELVKLINKIYNQNLKDNPAVLINIFLDEW
ncbi:MAG: UvrD-helicase domain-containing protein, partial [Planctomycetota bacterium]